MQSDGGAPRHTAIILDGNGRWAEARGLPRAAGHARGAERVREVIGAAPACGIEILSLFAFSSDNWRRPAGEVATLLALLARFLRAETRRAVAEGVRVEVIGRRDRLPAVLRGAIADAEAATRGGRRLRVRLAIDYSSRAAVARAARAAARGAPLTAGRLRRALGDVPDVDLLIRTGGERRLSDFLLLESAYAELCFVDLPWPEFGPSDLAESVRAFRARERRFGGLGAAAPSRLPLRRIS